MDLLLFVILGMIIVHKYICHSNGYDEDHEVGYD
jgi:hypothetical protein